MDRQAEVLKYIEKSHRGIEIGPFHSPLTPKRDGFNSLVLDVFDGDTLRQKAAAIESVPSDFIAHIEDVDLLGTADELDAMVEARGELGTFDYIVSSHNIEHLPNPIRFLRSCGTVLKANGILSMAIPDRRLCFDHFRPNTVPSAWISAFFEQRSRPTPSQVFDGRTLESWYARDGRMVAGFSLADHPEGLVPPRNLRACFQTWEDSLASADTSYHDTHCWTFTPASFALLLGDIYHVGLTPLALFEVSEPNGFEFYAHLRNVGFGAEDEEVFYARRAALLHRVNSEAGANTVEMFAMKARLEKSSLSAPEAPLDSVEAQKAKMQEQTYSRHVIPDPSDRSVVVVIAYYNGAAWVERAIHSVLAQTVPPQEFIIVNDGSKPEERAALSVLQQKYGFSMIDKDNGGQGSARNAGVAASKSTYISFLDQDDFYLPNHIKDLLGVVPEDDPLLGWVYADLVAADGAGNTLDSNMLRQQPGRHPKSGHIHSMLSNDLFILPSASLIYRPAYQAAGGFDEQFKGYEDDDLFLRLFRAGYTNYFLDKPVTAWCMHSGSTSWSIKMSHSRFRYFKKLAMEFKDDPEKGLNLFRDCLVPRFGRVFELEAIKAARTGSVNHHDTAKILREYCEMVQANPSVPQKQKRRLRNLTFFTTRFPVSAFKRLRLIYRLPVMRGIANKVLGL